MFIKDLVMWRHYNVILENSDITKRPSQHLAIIGIFSALTWYETSGLTLEGDSGEEVALWLLTSLFLVPKEKWKSPYNFTTSFC